MHPFSILTLGIFVAGYITARWDLVTRLYELAIFAWNYGVVVRSSRLPRCSWNSCAESRSVLTTHSLVQTRAAKGFAVLSLVFLCIFLPVERLATREGNLVRRYAPLAVSELQVQTDQPNSASARDGIRHFGQGTTKEAGLFLAGRLRTCCRTCQIMMV